MPRVQLLKEAVLPIVINVNIPAGISVRTSGEFALKCSGLPSITWSVGEQAWRQSRAALHSGSFTQAKIWGPQCLIMRATARGPEALKLSKRSTCKTPDLPQHQARAALHTEH